MAAHAYARVKRTPGVTTAASGPGTLNLLTGIYNAFIDNAPMVTLGGAGPLRDIYRDGFQEVDLPNIFGRSYGLLIHLGSQSTYRRRSEPR